jgi:hypothetical protein
MVLIFSGESFCCELALLTSLTLSKVKFEWLLTHQQAFDKNKKVTENEVFVSYPDFDKPLPHRH